jgi:ligand-binding SRPBCC domain-containing protein
MRNKLEFSSELSVSTEQAWQWATSIEGIQRELMPVIRMSFPKAVEDLSQIDVKPGERLFRSWILLGGFLPFDYSDLTFVELIPGLRFVEESPVGSMKYWRHERHLEATPTGTRISDRLSFEPRFPPRGVTVGFIRLLFTHRHRQLRKYLGDGG